MIHRKTDLPRKLEKDTELTLQTNKPKFERALQAIANDVIMKQIFHDLITCHYYTLFYYQTALAIIVEPVTWILVDPAFMKEKEKKLYDYFKFDSFNYLLASKILSRCESYLNRSNTKESRWNLIKAANNALDIPMATAIVADDTKEGFENLMNTIIDRFEKSLDGRQVDPAPQKEKTFANIMSYGLWLTENSGDINKTIIKILTEIATGEPELFGYAIDRMASWLNQPAYATPTILFNTIFDERKLIKLRYDKLTGLDSSGEASSPIGNRIAKSTGRPLNRIDDVVGDLPPLFSTALQIIHYFSAYKALVKPENELDQEEILMSCLNLGKNLKYFDKEYYDRYAAFLAKLFQNKPYNLSYDSLKDDHGFDIFLKFWLDLITDVGSGAKYLFMEHGMGA